MHTKTTFIVASTINRLQYFYNYYTTFNKDF
jgi:hypothetical protein